MMNIDLDISKMTIEELLDELAGLAYRPLENRAQIVAVKAEIMKRFRLIEAHNRK